MQSSTATIQVVLQKRALFTRQQREITLGNAH